MFGVLLRVVEDADDSGIAAGTHLAQDLEIFGAGADGQDLPAFGVAPYVHAVEIETEQMGKHQLQGRIETGEMGMSVVKIVDDADVADAMHGLQTLTDGDHVLGFARPSAMIVEGDLAPDLRRLGDHGQEGLRGMGDLGLLGVPLGRRDDPDLGLQPMLLKKTEGLVMLGPEGEKLEAVLLVGEDLAFEFGHMFGPPVIGDLGDAELGHHLGALLGTPLAVVKRDDAPGREVLQLIDRLRERSCGEQQEACGYQTHQGCPYDSFSNGRLPAFPPLLRTSLDCEPSALGRVDDPRRPLGRRRAAEGRADDPRRPLATLRASEPPCLQSGIPLALRPTGQRFNQPQP